MESVILQSYEYLASQPGKHLRSHLIEAIDAWLRVPSQTLASIKHIVEMLHNASLLVDDVEDGSVLRRGVPVAHKIYGTAQVINCANYVYFKALSELLELCSGANDGMKTEAVMRDFTREMLNLHTGQHMDIYWRDSTTCPSEDQYLEMINNKTGGLLRLGVKLMLHFSTSSPNSTNSATNDASGGLEELVNAIGVLYQIRDDYINLASAEYHKNKSFCEDLTEGKFSFPIIHSIRTSSPSHATQLLNILKQRTNETELKQYAVKMMHKTNSFTYTRTYLKQVEMKARALIKQLGGNDKLEKILDYLSQEYTSTNGDVDEQTRES